MGKKGRVSGLFAFTANKEPEMKTIDITPTWQTIVSIGCEVIANPNADQEAKESFRDELMRLAKIVDDQNAEAKKNQWTTLDVIVAEERAKGNLI
jgi:hypothetical protein